ncbi:MAG: hypothetical protein ACKVS8_06415 [Phycisphaerales bacterium]
MLDTRLLSLALGGLEPPFEASAEGLRGALDWARAAGFRAVHLNAAAAGLRPRDLDRSARRDVAAILRRNELALSGLDLWVPAEHFADARHAERAVAAVVGAIELAAELRTLAGERAGAGSVCVSIVLPRPVPGEVVGQLRARADAAGVRVADCALPLGEASEGDERDPMAVGLDPAGMLLANVDACKEASRLGKRVACARLSDLSPSGRIAPGDKGGRLSLTEYAVATALGCPDAPVVLDLRGVADPQRAAASALRAWAAAL